MDALLPGQQLAPCPTCQRETIQERSHLSNWVCLRCKAIGQLAADNAKLRGKMPGWQIALVVAFALVAAAVAYVLGV